MNLYTYVGGNPVSNIDPLGLETCVLVTQGLLGVGTHAALYTSHGSNGGPALYDPSGNYHMQSGNNDPVNSDIEQTSGTDHGFQRQLEHTYDIAYHSDSIGVPP